MYKDVYTTCSKFDWPPMTGRSMAAPDRETPVTNYTEGNTQQLAC